MFLLAPPASDRCLYTLKFRVSGVNPFAPDLRRHPRFSDVAMLEATLEPMDLIFVPKYWWHCVYALDPSLNVNTWSAASGMAPTDVIAQLPLAVQIFERLDRNATVHRVVEALAAGYGALSMGI